MHGEWFKDLWINEILTLNSNISRSYAVGKCSQMSLFHIGNCMYQKSMAETCKTWWTEFNEKIPWLVLLEHGAHLNTFNVLYIDLRPGQTCHSKVMHQKEVTHSDGSYEKKSRRWAWLKIWDKVKSHSTLIDWCTGREWPVNCTTVISAWWRSNMPFQRLSGRLNNYITQWRQEVSQLEIRWVRDKMW